MGKIPRTQFGKEIETRLIALGETHEWLIEEVSLTTGLYFDRSYLNKIKVGQLNTPKIVQAIKKILQISDVLEAEEVLKETDRIETGSNYD